MYGILCDGNAFHFFRYDRAATHLIGRGIFTLPRTNSTGQDCLKLANLQSDSHLDFWRSVRVISEAIFYVLLLSYKNSLHAYHERFAASAKETDKSRTMTLEWFTTLQSSTRAVGQAVRAGGLHVAGEVTRADSMALEAMESLKMRYSSTVPGFSI